MGAGQVEIEKDLFVDLKYLVAEIAWSQPFEAPRRGASVGEDERLLLFEDLEPAPPEVTWHDTQALSQSPGHSFAAWKRSRVASNMYDVRCLHL